MTQTAGDTDTWFSYKQTTAGTLIAHARFTNWDNRIRVNFGTASAVLYQNDAAVQTVLDSNASAGSDLNQWYDIYFRCEGSRIEVWRGKRGEPLERILFSDAATETASGQLRFTIPASTNYRIDNIQVMKPDAPNVVTTTSVYNDANELTSTTTGGVTTAYTYDGWGRTISKTDGTHDAAYTWRFGDKLRVYTSDFPGEADVAYNYDGLGNRRNRLNNPNGAYTDADLTWYRWGTEWNLIGEYESDDYATWDVGDLKHWYLGKAAQVNGSSPAIGDYRYYTTDHLGSPRAVYSQAQAVIATQEFTPFGSYHTTSGIDQTIGFTGHQWDDSTQAVYAPFRNYGPDAARWLSRDPLGMVDGENLYVYVMNNASNLIDELGLFSSLQGCAQMPGVCGGVLAPKPPPSLLPPLFLWPFVPGDKQPDPKPKKPECEYGDDPCEKQYDKEVALCGLVPRHRREACYRQAGQRFSECTTFGAPRSPFPYP
jgi:RHS repeat-associated protein